MQKLKKFLLAGLILALCLIAVFFYSFTDKCFLLFPLPANIPLEIRVDSFGNGHFGTPRTGRRKHRGIDISAPINTAVLSVKTGLVVKTAFDNSSGNYVVIWHWPNLKSYYLHLSKIDVKKWQFVKQGQMIGRVGRTGNANNKRIKPHLHFEIRKIHFEILSKEIPQDILKKWQFTRTN